MFWWRMCDKKSSFLYSRCPAMLGDVAAVTIGSLRNDDGDGYENVT